MKTIGRNDLRRANRHLGKPTRREFLQWLGIGALGLAVSGKKLFALDPTGTKILRGIFPIAQTPFTAADKLDLDALAREVEFTARGRVHGLVWPQMASEWTVLTEQERFEGAEAICAAGKKVKPAIVIGVQGSDLAAVRRYVNHARQVGADAVISLPPSENADAKTLVEYYQAVGGMSDLPLFVQAVGNITVDALLEMFRTIPTMRYIKDEFGEPLVHAALLREKTSDQLKLFSGSHGRKLIEEMNVGFSGSMPAAGLADLYARTFDLWQEGKHDEARAMQARTMKALDQMLAYGMEGMKYVLYERGVFKTYSARKAKDLGFTATAAIVAGGVSARPLDDTGKKALGDMLVSLKPYLTA
jgi:dihydrodipicolinate synthase/N-acetylneuraminate lyase